MGLEASTKDPLDRIPTSKYYSVLSKPREKYTL